MDTELSDYSEEALYNFIGKALLRSLPEGWQEVRLTFEIIDEDVSETSAIVNKGDDKETYISLRPSGMALDDGFIEIARRMSEAGHGQWQLAQLTMNRVGKFTIDYTYPE